MDPSNKDRWVMVVDGGTEEDEVGEKEISWTNSDVGLKKSNEKK